MKMRSLAVAACALAFVVSAYAEENQPAAEKPAKSAKSKTKAKAPPKMEYRASEAFEEAALNSWRADDFKKFAKQLDDEKSRRPANDRREAHADPKDISKYMHDFQERLLAARTSADVNKLFKDLEAQYAEFSANAAAFNDPKNQDFKYFYARVSPARKMGGYTWRMVPAIQKVRASQEVLVGMIRSIAEQVMVHTGASHHEALFRYMTEPQPDYMTQFRTENDVQAFYINEVAPSIQKSLNILKSLNLKKPIVYNSQLRFGDASFPDKNEKQYRLIGGAEHASIMARLHRRLAAIQVFCAYDFTDYLKIRDMLSHEQGMAIVDAGVFAALARKPDIGDLTRQRRVEVMKEFPKFGGLVQAGKWGKKPNGQPSDSGATLMKYAYNNLYQSAVLLDAARQSLDHRDASFAANSDWLIDPSVFGAREELNETATKNLLALTSPGQFKANSTEFVDDSKKGQRTIASSLTGNSVDVNLRAYFQSPPKNLKEMLPTDFNDEESKWLPIAGGNCTDRKHPSDQCYRNYFYGRATGWSPKAYKNLFPGVSSAQDVAVKMDVLTESRGGRVAANFLVPFVR